MAAAAAAARCAWARVWAVQLECHSLSKAAAAAGQMDICVYPRTHTHTHTHTHGTGKHHTHCYYYTTLHYTACTVHYSTVQYTDRGTPPRAGPARRVAPLPNTRAWAVACRWHLIPPPPGQRERERAKSASTLFWLGREESYESYRGARSAWCRQQARHNTHAQHNHSFSRRRNKHTHTYARTGGGQAGSFSTRARFVQVMR